MGMGALVVGSLLGWDVGLSVGSALGTIVGMLLATLRGTWLGSAGGSFVGTADGDVLGAECGERDWRGQGVELGTEKGLLGGASERRLPATIVGGDLGTEIGGFAVVGTLLGFLDGLVPGTATLGRRLGATLGEAEG